MKTHTSYLFSISTALLSLFLFTILFSTLASALNNYTAVGGTDGSFYNSGAQTGLFSNLLIDLYTHVRTIAVASPYFMPYVVDLNRDNRSEIIVASSQNIRLFNADNLSPINSYDTGTSEFLVPRIKDWDNSGYQEIIVAYQNNSVIVTRYNGTTFNSTKKADVKNADNQKDEGVLGCSPTRNICITAMHGRQTTPATAQMIFVTSFNDSGIIGVVNYTMSSTTSNPCFPNINKVGWGDVNNDGTEDAVISYYNVNGGAGDIAYVQAYTIPLNSPPSVLWTQTGISGSDLYPGSAGASTYCHDAPIIGSHITAPYVADLDSSPANGLETIIGFQTDADSFKMYKISGSGVYNSLTDQYPATSPSDGIIISDVMKSDIFGDTPDTDFCVLGYQASATIPLMDLVCASLITGDVPKTRDFRAQMQGTDFQYNVTSDRLFWHQISHMTQMGSTEYNDGWGNKDVTEILNAFGVFRPIITNSPGFDACGTAGTCQLERLYTLPFMNSTTIPIDAQNIGHADIIALSNTNLYYLDDGFANTPCSGEQCVNTYYSNPCNGSIWLENTSVEIRITTQDLDNDNVAGRVLLYAGDSNEQDSGWTSFAPAGTTLSFLFTANKSIPVAYINVQTRDDYTPSEVGQLNRTFGVSSVSGVEFNDCTTTEVVSATPIPHPPVNVTPVIDEDADIIQNNSIGALTQAGKNLTGLSQTLIWYLIMIVVGIYIFVVGAKQYPGHPHMVIGVMSFFEVLMMIFGVKLNYIGFGTLVALVIICIAIIGTFAIRKTQGL